MNVIERVVSFLFLFFPVRSHQIPHFVRAFPNGDHVRMTRVRRAKSCRHFLQPLRKKVLFLNLHPLGAVMAGCIGRILQHRLLSASVSHGGQLLACRFLFAALVVCFCGSISSFFGKTSYLTLFSLLLWTNGIWLCTTAETGFFFLVSLLGFVLPSVPVRWIFFWVFFAFCMALSSTCNRIFSGVRGG